MPTDDTDAFDRQRLKGLQLAFDHLPLGAGVFTLSGRPVYLNRYFIELYGLQWWSEDCDMDFQDMLEHGAFRDWKIDPRQHLTEMLETVLSGRAYEAEIEQGDRIIRMHNRLMTPDFILSTQEDVTARVRAERQVSYLALHDPLTRLLNRAGFVAQLKDMLKRKASNGEPFGIISLDLDHFKDVNDIFGHMAGDTVLRATAARMRSALGPLDFAGRLGGDEFVIVAGSDQQPGAVNLIASLLQTELCRPVAFEGQMLRVGTSIGIAVYPRDGEDRATLISNADMALYRAKREGRGRACAFDHVMDRHARERRLQMVQPLALEGHDEIMSA
jgi:diguanylate cyclase (GGDEF)-like protein